MASIINATTTNGVAVQGDNSGSLQLQTNNGTTAVTIDTSQNVGIGTTSPTTKLDVSGTTKATTLQTATLNSTSGVLATQNGMTGIAKAWVNFNGTNGAVSGTPFNVSSVTRNSTGNYSINITTALPNANYSAVIGASYLSGGVRYVNRLTGTFPTSTTVCTAYCNDGAGNSVDVDSISVAVFSS